MPGTQRAEGEDTYLSLRAFAFRIQPPEASVSSTKAAPCAAASKGLQSRRVSQQRGKKQGLGPLLPLSLPWASSLTSLSQPCLPHWTERCISVFPSFVASDAMVRVQGSRHCSSYQLDSRIPTSGSKAFLKRRLGVLCFMILTRAILFIFSSVEAYLRF